jgi:fibronectin-binding autotransporter adhesin
MSSGRLNQRNRLNRRARLAAAAGAVSLFSVPHWALAQEQPTDTFSFIYNYGAMPLDGDLAAASNWYDLTTNSPATAAPSAPSTVEFDTTYADMVGPGVGITLSSAAATTWAEVNFLSPAAQNQWVTAGGTTVAFVLTLTGSNNAALTIGGSGGNTPGLSVLGNFQGNGLQPTDVAIAVPVNLGAAQTWTANASSVTVASVVTATTVLAVSGNLSLGGFGAHALTLAGTGNVGLTGIISDGGAASGIVMNGTGTLNLAAANTFSGGLTLNSGTVQVSNSQALGAPGNLVQFNGSTLNLAGTALTNLNSYSINGAAPGTASTWNGVPLNLSIGSAANTFTLANSMTGTGFLNQTGPGAIWITQATNTFTGGTTLASGGGLVIPDIAALGNGAVNNSGTILVTGNSTISGNSAGTGALFAGAPFGSTVANPFGTLTLTNAGGSVVNSTIGVTNGGNLVFDESQSNGIIPLVQPGNINSASSLIASGGNITFVPNATATTVQVFSTTSFSNANTITATGAVGQETVFLGDYSYDNANNIGTYSVTQTASASVMFNGPVTASGGNTFFGGTAASSDFAVVGNVYSAPAILSNQEPPGKGAPGYATYGLSDWAAVTTPNAGGTSYIVPGSSISGFYIHLSILSNSGTPAEPVYEIPRACAAFNNDNIDVDCNGAADNISNSAPTSIRFNSPTGGLSIIGGQTALQWLCGNSVHGLLECADILVTPNVGAENVIFSDDVNTLAGASGATTQDIDPNGRTNSSVNADIWNNDFQGNTAGMLIFATGISNSDFSGGITEAGPGMVVLATTSTYTGSTVIDGGTLEIQNNAALGGSATSQNSLNFFGGTFVTMQTTTLDGTIFGPTGAGTARAINVNIGGADLAAIHAVVSGQTLAQTLTVDGAITGNGNLNIGMGNVTAVENNNTNSTLAFVNTSGNGKVILSGNATGFTGNIALNFGALQADGTFSSSTNFTAASGTTLSGASPSTLAGVTANTGSTLYPGDNGTGAMTVAQYTGNNNSTLSFGLNSTTYASTDPLDITIPLGGSGNLVNPAGTVWLTLLETGTNQEYLNSGEYDLINVFGSTSAFSPINGTFGLPSANVGGFEITGQAGFPGEKYYSLQTLAVGNNETELQLTINNPNNPSPSGWINPLGGPFNNPGNWSGDKVPEGPGVTAQFPSLTATTISVTVPVPWTIGGFHFNTTNSYTISGTGPIAFAEDGLDSSIQDSLGQNETISAPIDISGVPALDLTVTNATDALTLSGGITDDGAGSGLSLNASNLGGAGSAILLGTQKFSGSITIGNQLGTGTLQLGNGSTAASLGSNTAAINLNAGTLAFDEPSGTTATLTNTIVVPAVGGGTLLQEGAGSLLILASTVSYSAPYPNVQLNAGALRFAGAGSDNVGNFTQYGGLLDLGGQRVSLGSLTGTGTIDNLSSTAAALTVNSQFNGTYSGVIQNSQSGTVTFIKDGFSIQVFNGTNTYTGGTILSGGGIEYLTQSSIPTQGTFTLGVSAGSGPMLGPNVTFGLPIFVNDGGVEDLVSLPFANETAAITGPITLGGGGAQYRMGYSGTTGLLYVGGSDIVPAADYCFFPKAMSPRFPDSP